MTDLIKTFPFVADVEDWSFVNVSGGPGITGAWKVPKQNLTIPYSGLGYDYTLNGGSLRCSVCSLNNSAASQNYWQWEGTYEQLGVPAGSIIESVQADYCYRWIAVKRGDSPNNPNYLSMSLGDARVGPFELRNSGGTLIDTFSSAQDCPARVDENDWKKYPLGTDQFPIQEIPDAWAQVIGSPIMVAHPSSDPIKLRINNQLPQALSGSMKYLFLKIDHIVVTITYSESGVENGLRVTQSFNLLKRR